MAQQTRLGLYGGPRPVYGSFAGKAEAGDTTPDAFSFTDVTDQAIGSLITSNIITVSGIDAAAAVTFIETGHLSGEYRVDSGTWLDLANFNIENAETLQLRLTSSASNSTLVSIQVTIGGVSDTWDVTTLAAVVVADEPSTLGGGGAKDRLEKIAREDEEIMVVIRAYIKKIW